MERERGEREREGLGFEGNRKEKLDSRFGWRQEKV